MLNIVVSERDKFVVGVLERFDVKHSVLRDGQYAQPQELAIFSVNGENVHFPGKHARLAVHRLIEAGVVPAWAATTPYIVALKDNFNDKRRGEIGRALKNIIQVYEEWFSGLRGFDCPWGSKPTGNAAILSFENWKTQNIAVLTNSFSPEVKKFFSLLEPLNNKCLRGTVGKIDNPNELRAVSALCLHNEKNGLKIADDFRTEIVEAVVKMVDSLPISQLDVFTFHPDCLDTFRYYGLEKIIHQPLRNEKQLQRHWELSQKIAKLSPKIRLRSIAELFQNEIIADNAFRTSRARAGMILKEMRGKQLPSIIRDLSSPERKERLAAEAMPYLLMTAHFPDSVYIGLEIRSGFIKTGGLYKWGKNYLPVVWAPKCLRQPWVNWAVDAERVAAIQKLDL